MQIPKLKGGQTVGIVVPARKADEELLRKGAEHIESWGLKVQFGNHCFNKDTSYLAAPDSDRLKDLQNMIDDPSIAAIFCARGGYGTTRILDKINFERFVKSPKWIIGFSDITALHLKLSAINVESIHSCMPIQFSKPEYKESISTLKEILFNGKSSIINTQPNQYNRFGAGKGKLVGGNLSLVVDSLGTSTEIDTVGKILILEEVDERLYKVDRMLTQLKRADKLSRLSGLILGHFTDLSDTELPFGQNLEDLVMDKVLMYSYPVAFDFPIGHQAPNLAWIHGAVASIDVSQNTSELKF